MKLNVREIAIFSMLGAMMFASKVLMDVLPNIHLIGTFIVAITVVYRKKALYPLYIFVFVTGLLNGFATWWIAYLYIWTVLWGATMLLPKTMSPGVACIVYPSICAAHGFAYGVLYAPAQALMYGFGYEQTIAWIISGIGFDITHGISNIFTGMLVLPLTKLTRKLAKPLL